MQINKKKPEGTSLSFLDKKALYFKQHKSVFMRKRWYKKNRKGLVFRVRCKRWQRRLIKPRIRFKPFDAARWVIYDFLNFNSGIRKFWGIYQFVALPGEGKTLSMVAHMERAVKKHGKDNIFIATNFFYRKEDMEIHHWSDIIKAAQYARKKHMRCIIAIDEIHTTFDASDWKSFPAEMLALLSFNRKYSMQFLCSSQIYDRIPKKIRDIANYTVICKNVSKLDRYFWNYYFEKTNYEEKFAGKRKLCNSIATFVADNDLFAQYDTLRQVERMTENAMQEKNRKEEAFDLLFGAGNGEEEDG